MAVTAGIALAAMPAAASAAASSWQLSDFRLAGGTRFTLTLSPQQQIPGVDPAIWPKGYRYVCGYSGPVLRHRINWSYGTSDYVDFETDGLIAKPGSLRYSRLGRGRSYNLHGAVSGSAPRTVDSFVHLDAMVGLPERPAQAAQSPALGLYDFRLVPYSQYLIVPGLLSPVLPAAAVAAKIDVRQGTAAECPPMENATSSSYYRASK